MSDITVSAARLEDIEPFVASVVGLFQEDGGRHDRFLDTEWPVREGASYYASLVGDQACLLAVARDSDRVVGHLVGKLVGPDSMRLARFAVLESMRGAAGCSRDGRGEPSP